MIFRLDRKPKTPIANTTVLRIIYQLNGTIS
jgi:hypothetical protein